MQFFNICCLYEHPRHILTRPTSNLIYRVKMIVQLNLHGARKKALTEDQLIDFKKGGCRS